MYMYNNNTITINTRQYNTCTCDNRMGKLMLGVRNPRAPYHQMKPFMTCTCTYMYANVASMYVCTCITSTCTSRCILTTCICIVCVQYMHVHYCT